MLKRCTLLAALVFGALVAAQGVFFLRILTEPSRIVHADLIAAFEGRPERTREAYTLADRGYASTLVISPAEKQQLEAFGRQYQTDASLVVLPEEKARTTFENALYTSRIIRAHGYKRIILVTSWNHIPRSCLLLKLMLVGSDTRIYPHPVATGAITSRNWYHRAIGWEMIYNEMVESWGSIVELVGYKIKSDLPRTQSGKSFFPTALKKFILFKITDKTLADA